MRHLKHRHQLGRKKEHREALMANLSTALFKHGRIETTLPKAKALRPFAEKIITLAVRAARTEDGAKKLHLRRLAVSRVRDKAAVRQLFDERAGEFTGRNGGYTRIYKLMPRAGDAAPMAIIELIDAGDEGYKKPARKKQAAKKAAAKKAAPAAEEAAPEAAVETATAEAGEEAAAEPKAGQEAPQATGDSGEESPSEKKD